MNGAVLHVVETAEAELPRRHRVGDGDGDVVFFKFDV